MTKTKAVKKSVKKVAKHGRIEYKAAIVNLVMTLQFGDKEVVRYIPLLDASFGGKKQKQDVERFIPIFKTAFRKLNI